MGVLSVVIVTLLHLYKCVARFVTELPHFAVPSLRLCSATFEKPVEFALRFVHAFAHRTVSHRTVKFDIWPNIAGIMSTSGLCCVQGKYYTQTGVVPIAGIAQMQYVQVRKELLTS